MHSRSYRIRYAAFLRSDFPRIPLANNLTLFNLLSRLGSQLVDLHLLESPKFIENSIEFIGANNPVIDKPSWSNNIVWLDKTQTSGFKDVTEDVWNFYIGSYQVCYKWLKDRNGRKLTDEDINFYKKIVFAISETNRLMVEIDNDIEQHGGWPSAFHNPAGPNL